MAWTKTKLCLFFLIGLPFFSLASGTNGDVVHDFGTNPIVWNSNGGPVTFDANGDLTDDFVISVTTGFIDPTSSRYVIDNQSTSSGDIEKLFVFSISSLDPNCPVCTFNLLGFDFYSEKNIESGGQGGAGSIGVDVFDDADVELVDDINISGSLGSNPTRVVLPPDVTTTYFVLAVDRDPPPGNNDAQVILGNFIFNGGSVVCSAIAVPEATGLPIFFSLAGLMLIYPRRRSRLKYRSRNMI